MLGDARGCEVRDGCLHPGSILKAKAAEVGILFEWSRKLLEDMGSELPRVNLLVASGDAMAAWLN